jgi:hypothetical protein
VCYNKFNKQGIEMTTTVAQMIEALKKLPQDAEIECGYEVQTCSSAYMGFAPVDVNGFTIYDYTSSEDHVTYPNMAGLVLVMINTTKG